MNNNLQTLIKKWLLFSGAGLTMLTNLDSLQRTQKISNMNSKKRAETEQAIAEVRNSLELIQTKTNQISQQLEVANGAESSKTNSNYENSVECQEYIQDLGQIVKDSKNKLQKLEFEVQNDPSLNQDTTLGNSINNVKDNITEISKNIKDYIDTWISGGKGSGSNSLIEGSNSILSNINLLNKSDLGTALTLQDFSLLQS